MRGRAWLRSQARSGADAVLPLVPGAGPDGLLAEAARRIRVLAPVPFRHDRDKIVAVPGAARPGIRLGAGQDEVLALADGRRTARDLAFALGRGVYATMLQLARMRQAGLLVTVPSRASGPDGRGQGRPGPGGEQPGGSGLPRRRQGLPRRIGPSGGKQDSRVPGGLLRPRYGQAVTTGQVHND
jgi:hypothetical protein